MFIGHYSAAFVAASYPKSSRLGPLFVAAQLVDFAFFVFTLIGIEHLRLVPGMTAMNSMDLYDMRWTHSVVGALGWAGLWAFVSRLVRGDWSAAWIGAAVVFSHWLLDLLVHRPDLTVAGAGERYGLGLWNHPAIEIPLELALTFGALAFYAWRTRSIGVWGTISLSILGILLLGVQMIDWFGAKPTAIVDPAPPRMAVVALAGYTMLALVAWWVARTRRLA